MSRPHHLALNAGLEPAFLYPGPRCYPLPVRASLRLW